MSSSQASTNIERPTRDGQFNEAMDALQGSVHRSGNLADQLEAQVDKILGGVPQGVTPSPDEPVASSYPDRIRQLYERQGNINARIEGSIERLRSF